VSGVLVEIDSGDNSTYSRYLVHPPEYDMNPGHLKVVSDTIKEISAHPPEGIDVASLEVLRPYIESMARDMIYSRLAAKGKGLERETDTDKISEHLASVVSKYTSGYGILETLLDDPRVQDIYINAPSSQNPVFAVLRSDVQQGVRQKCRTNVYVGRSDMQSFVSRMKLETGLPFSEASPVLEADISRLGCRVTLVSPPICDRGVSVAIRKHTRRMLTLPVLIANGCLSPLLSSLLWTCVVGRRTVLIAGSRGAGKTTLLGAMMLEFPLSQRILVVEDTAEIPVRRLRDLGFDIQTLRFSVHPDSGTISAKDALRVSLRMGESAIVIGEVRGAEAQVLYESMRAGSAGSSVLGTIHGNSAEGVLDRAIEDLGVSERAFSSTDLVIVMGLMRTPDGTRFTRGIQEVSEVQRHRSGVQLVPLFETEHSHATVRPTDHWRADCETISKSARALGISNDDLMTAIQARARCDQMLSELCGRERDSLTVHDRIRVISNETQARWLLTPGDEQNGMEAWREWYDGIDAQNARKAP